MEVMFPSTLEEMQEMRATIPDGLILAGGTDLLVRLRKSRQQPSALLCTEHLTEMQLMEFCKEEMRIGASVTLQRLLECDTIRETLPVLYQAVASMASPPVRHAATIGGNICTASPAGDTLPPLHVLGASVELLGPAGMRKMPIGEFITGPGKTAAQSEEVVTGIVIPKPPAGTLSAYHKVGKRQAMAIAVASLAVVLNLMADATVASIRLAWGSVGPTVVTLPAVEKFLTGRHLSMEVLQEAGRMAASGVQPIDDVRADAAYRRQLAGNLLLRLSSIS